jgi:hypothetical protein
VLGQKRPHPLATGLVCFFLLLIRNTNAILIATLALAYVRWRIRRDGTSVGATLRGLIGPVVGGGIAVAVQLAINSYYKGGFTLVSYGEPHFVWDRPMQGPVLFSYERGLFTYYPVVAVVLAAAWLTRRTRGAAAWFTLLVLAYATLYGFWWSWMLGGGFGHRGFVELMPLAAVLFAAALRDMTPRWRTAACQVALVATVVTVQCMIAYWRNGLPFMGATAAAYWTCVCGRRSVLWFLF